MAPARGAEFRWLPTLGRRLVSKMGCLKNELVQSKSSITYARSCHVGWMRVFVGSISPTFFRVPSNFALGLVCLILR